MKSFLQKSTCLAGLASIIAMPIAVAGTPDATPAASAAPVAAQSLRVVRDRNSGNLRAPTAEELGEMDASAQPSAASAEIVVQTSADGMKSATLTEEYMMQLNAGVAGDGAVFLSHGEPVPAQPATKLEEK